MSAESILNVTNAIKQRLLGITTDEARAPLSATIHLGPLDTAAAARTDLVLFLYRITPSATLRNSEHRVAQSTRDSQVQVFSNALPLDLHYLLTLGTLADPGSPESLRILGYAMQALNDSPLLIGSQVNDETIRLTLDSGGTEEMSRIWALFPSINYRTSVLYLASPVWIDPFVNPTAAAPAVSHNTTAGQ